MQGISVTTRNQCHFGAATTAQEVIRGRDLSDKIVLITGAGSGIGFEIARAMSLAGADVIVPARDLERGCELADKLITNTGNVRVRSYQMDLINFDSVRRFACNCLADYGRVDMLINNAGITAGPLARSAEGYESQFAVNHLGHFLLTACLWEGLRQSAACRVISVSSIAHRLSAVSFDDIHFERRPYDPWLAYAQSKTAVALFTLALNDRLEASNGRAFAVHPGVVASTGSRQWSREELAILGCIDRKYLKTPSQAAATAVWAALCDELTEQGGAYCEDCQLAPPLQSIAGRNGVHAHARDAAAAARLWEVSEHMVDCRLAPAVSPRLDAS